MVKLRIPKLHWLMYISLLLVLTAATACGTAAPDTPVPAAPTQAPAAATQPPATVSAQVGQGAIGVPPTPVPTAVPAPAMEETPTVPAVTLLKVARGPTTWDFIDPIGGRGDLPFLLPMYEGLVQFDQFTDSQPMLSPKWSANADFTVWRFELRKGVQFHKGWGEMTAKDVAHTMGQERRLDHKDGRAATWRALLDRVEMPDGPDGYVVELHLNKPEPIMTTYMSTNYTTVLRSKKTWDDGGGQLSAEFEPNELGIQLMVKEPIGTGPYQFVEHAESQFIRYEAPDFQHWRITPDFPELQIFFVAEASTQLAMLVTGEVHSAEIPRDIQVGALSRGMKVVSGTTPAIRLVGFFGGNFIPSREQYDPSQPMTKQKVRQAMNLAINREEINEVFFGNRAEPMMQTHSHPKFPGWEPSWLGRFEEAYGYDPERAKELLAEAGYPNGFSITQQSYPRPGLPEMQDIGELINSYWKQIGIEAKFQPVERSVNTKIVNSQKTQNIAWLHTGSFTEPTRAIFVYHYTGAAGPRFEDPFFDVKYEALEIARTAEERSQLIREMGEFCFEIYCSIPLFWVPFEFMIDPKVIAEWKTPGVFGVRDFEYVKATR